MPGETSAGQRRGIADGATLGNLLAVSDAAGNGIAGEGSGEPDVADLDALPTSELRDRAFHKARHKLDIRFFWDLVKHLPSATAVASEDASTGEITGGFAELAELGHEWAGSDLGDREPLVRARFIEYLRED